MNYNNIFIHSIPLHLKYLRLSQFCKKYAIENFENVQVKIVSLH
jgi:hypothetical protein